MAELQVRAGTGTAATLKLFMPLQQYAAFSAKWLADDMHGGSPATMSTHPSHALADDHVHV